MLFDQVEQRPTPIMVTEYDWISLQPYVSDLQPQTERDIELALQIATKAHKDQFRVSGEPFVIHPIRSLRYLKAAGCRHQPHLVGALLHDVPEDSPWYLDTTGAEYFRGARFFLESTGSVDGIERLRALFGPDVAKIVDSVTKDSLYPHKSKFIEDRKYLRQVAQAGEDAWLVKMVDRLDNLLTLGAMPPIKQRRKIAETRRDYMPIFKRAAVAFPEEGRILYSQINAELTCLEQRLLRIVE